MSAACVKKIRAVSLPALRHEVRAQLSETGWQMEIDREDSQTVLFNYPSAVAPAVAGAYVRREVRIECGARSDAWPAEHTIVIPYMAEALAGVVADDEVAVKVLAIERTYWEKATILHAEAHREEGKPTPTRFSRHYADLAALAAQAEAKAPMNRSDLRERVVAHKQVFFASTWASYETAVPGSFRLVTGEARLQILAQDYRDMREMFFGEPPPWEEIVARLRALEKNINGPG